MVVRPSAAPASSSPRPTRASRRAAAPERTCIGCRQRAAAAELLRVVVARDARERAGSGPILVVPDLRHRAPGRGAWLHPVPACVDLAERRRAYGRALRVPGAVDPAPVREFVAAQPGARPDPDPRS